MGKASRRKRERRNEPSPYWNEPIKVIGQPSGEVIAEFTDPDLARRFSQEIMSGATKEEVTEFVSKAISEEIARQQAAKAVDGDTQNG